MLERNKIIVDSDFKKIPILGVILSREYKGRAYVRISHTRYVRITSAGKISEHLNGCFSRAYYHVADTQKEKDKYLSLIIKAGYKPVKEIVYAKED